MRKGVKRVRRSLCYIHSESAGTGFVVAEGMVLTCSHVAQGPLVVVPTAGSGCAPGPAAVIARSEELDLALLEAEAVRGRPELQLARSYCGPGMRVGLVGFPYADLFDPPMVQVSGAMIGNRYKFGGVDYYVLDAMVAEGSSGGPVFTEDGVVCGIVSSRFDPVKLARKHGLSRAKAEARRTCISFAVTSREAVKWLESVLARQVADPGRIAP